LNFSSLANDCGVSVDTARRWISVLKTGFVVLPSPARHRNYNIEETSGLYPVEIRSAATASREMIRSLLWWCDRAGRPPETAILILGG
jgi:hypothetical protein